MSRRTSRVIAVGTTVAILAISSATQANAYDRERYGFAAAHMLEFSEIPKSLGAIAEGLNFFVNPGVKPVKIYLCSGIPTSDPEEFKQVSVKVAGPSYSGSYTSDPSLSRAENNFRYISLSVAVNEFPTAASAAKTFDLIKERAKKCKGTKTTVNPPSQDDPGSTFTNTFFNGELASVTVDGRPSVYVETDFLNSAPQGSPVGDTGTDNMTIYSLVGDAIIQTFYTTTQARRLSAKQKAGVAEAANAAIRTWRG